MYFAQMFPQGNTMNLQFYQEHANYKVWYAIQVFNNSTIILFLISAHSVTSTQVDLIFRFLSPA